MKLRIAAALLLITITWYPSITTADISTYSYGNPTAAEQAHLEAINRARLNPVDEAANFGIALNEGLAPSTISSNPVEPLTMNAFLLSTARAHSADMIANDYFDHDTQSNGDTPFERMADAGFQISSAGENIAWRGSTGNIDALTTILQMHEDLFVDDGYAGRGHRINILRSGFKEVGLGTAFGQYESYTNTYMISCDFGTASDYSNSFVLGVVYNDTNSNSSYDAGEGISNVTISIDDLSGSFSTTATAGGYGIPLPNGTYAIAATLPNGTTVEKSLTIAGKNVKIDFLLSEITSDNPPGDTTDPAPDTDTDGESSSSGGCFIQSSSVWN